MDKINADVFETFFSHDWKNPALIKATTELGIVSTILALKRQEEDEVTKTLCGHLLRTKKAEYLAGGMCKGISALDDFYFN